jgi:predicted MFS family arabinose efflux permease
VAGVTGQLLGGALIEANFAGTGWRACFLINVPVVMIAVVAGALLLKKDAAARKPGASLDAGSALLASAALTSLIVPLTYGREALPMWINATLFAAAAMLGTLFVFNQRWRAARGLTPMVPPAVMAIPSFTLGVTTVLVFYVSVASFYFVLGLYLQTTHGCTALQSGLVFAALGAAFLTASLLGPRLQRALKRPLVECGALVLVAGHLAQAVMAWLGAPTLLAVLALLIEGVGLGLVMAPLVSLALARVPREHAGVGAGILSTMQSTGNALGVATVALFYVAGTGTGSQLDFARSLAGLALINVVVWRMACALRQRPA